MRTKKPIAIVCGSRPAFSAFDQRIMEYTKQTVRILAARMGVISFQKSIMFSLIAPLHEIFKPKVT